jgi:hypothetical protein
VYAEAVDLNLGRMTAATFSEHPLPLSVGGSVELDRITAEVRADGALWMLALVELGDVVRMGRPAGMARRLEEGISAVRDDLGPMSGMLVFDCILRRLESQGQGTADPWESYWRPPARRGSARTASSSTACP